MSFLSVPTFLYLLFKPGEIGQTTCKACLAGYSMFAFPVNTQCDACPAGRFSNGSAAILCAGCPFGYYQPLTAQTSCLKCSQGRTFSSAAFKNSLRSSQQNRTDVDTECGAPCPVSSYSLEKLPTWAKTRPVHECSVCAPGKAGLVRHTEKWKMSFNTCLLIVH